MQHRHHLAALAALGVIAASHPAAAGTHDESYDRISTHVSYRDLNVQSEGGARTLLRRIHYAARMVCEGYLDGGWQGRAQFFACMRDATDGAVAKLNSPLVSAMNGAGRGRNQVALAATRP